MAFAFDDRGEGHITGMTITEFHRVIAYAQPALDEARNSLNKHDRIQVDGKISYMPYKNADGKTIHGGFIVAHNINRCN